MNKLPFVTAGSDWGLAALTPEELVSLPGDAPADLDPPGLGGVLLPSGFPGLGTGLALPPVGPVISFVTLLLPSEDGDPLLLPPDPSLAFGLALSGLDVVSLPPA